MSGHVSSVTGQRVTHVYQQREDVIKQTAARKTTACLSQSALQVQIMASFDTFTARACQKSPLLRHGRLSLGSLTLLLGNCSSPHCVIVLDATVGSIHVGIGITTRSSWGTSLRHAGHRGHASHGGLRRGVRGGACRWLTIGLLLLWL